MVRTATCSSCERRRRCYALSVHLASAVFQKMPELEGDLRRRLASVASVESAAEACAECIYGALAEAVVLARVFCAVPARSLPARERGHAEAVQPIAGETPVLVLMGSRGERPAWNDRRASERHLAMPLTAAASAPMIASLLGDLGVELRVVDGRERIVETAPPALRTFYVLDARSTTDDGGRPKISDRGFVEEHDVRSVFGVGGSRGDQLFAIIVFARQHVTRTIADQLLPLADELGAAIARATSLFEPR